MNKLVKIQKHTKSSDEIRLKKVAKELSKVLEKLDEQGKLNLSFEEQLKDI